MVDRVSATAILDSARSEVKRWGGAEPSLTHAAFVLAQKWVKEFAEVFGDDGKRRVQELLSSKQFCGSEQQLAEILRDGEDRLGVVRAIHAEIRPFLESPAEPAASSEPVTAEASDTASEEGETTAAADLSERSSRVLQRVAPAASGHLRSREALDAAAQILRTQPVITALVGDPGVGRTSALAVLAARLESLPTPIPVWRMGPDTIVSNPAATLRMVLSDAEAPTVLVVDDLDLLADLASDSPQREFLDAIEAARFHPHVRLVVVLNRRYLSRLALISQSLEDILQIVEVREFPPHEVRTIVRAAGDQLAARRDLVLSDAAVDAALVPGTPLDGQGHPGLALSRLYLACARAYLVGDSVVEVAHLGAAAESTPIQEEALDLASALAAHVKGQPEAIAGIAQRLTLTRANLDLRPNRPNGVFLFVGPTGVGKTQLAREIAVHEYGGVDRLIRLDMSEYTHDWAISRIAGPAPGYVGSTEPESWLTTKVAAMPRCVVLLDEIEKAHPRVWNMFLQVFDAGRLTDGRGVTADFSNTVVVMTSNLGVQEARTQAVGFGGGNADLARDRLLAVVRERMAPELLNRLDEIIVFDALSTEAIMEIAEYELQAVRGRLSAAGWSVEWSPEVPAWLASTGYDPAYGARHLQRNIERELLSLLATAPARKLRVGAESDRLVVVPT